MPGAPFAITQACPGALEQECEEDIIDLSDVEGTLSLYPFCALHLSLAQWIKCLIVVFLSVLSWLGSVAGANKKATYES